MLSPTTTRPATPGKAKLDLDSAMADYTKAIEIKSRVMPSPTTTAAWPGKPRGFDSAMADYDKAIELNPNLSPPAYDNRGERQGSAQGDYNGAIADYDKAIGLKSKNAYMATTASPGCGRHAPRLIFAMGRKRSSTPRKPANGRNGRRPSISIRWRRLTPRRATSTMPLSGKLNIWSPRCQKTTPMPRTNGSAFTSRRNRITRRKGPIKTGVEAAGNH